MTTCADHAEYLPWRKPGRFEATPCDVIQIVQVHSLRRIRHFLLIPAFAAAACSTDEIFRPSITIPDGANLDMDCWPQQPGGWCQIEYDYLVTVISSISGDQHCNEMAQVLWDLLESGQIEKWTDLNGPVAEVDVAGGAPFGPGRYNYIRLNYQYFWAASSSHNYVGEALRHEYGHGHQPSAVHRTRCSSS